MQKLVSIVYALLFMAVVSGCGNNNSVGISTVTPPAVLLTAADVSGKTFYSTTVSTTVKGYSAYQINAIDVNNIKNASWNSSAGNPPTATDTTGTWSISSTGVLTLSSTITPAASRQFTCIQKETTYFLMSDGSNNISRFYFDTPTTTGLAAAQAYLASITVTKLILGGSIQGTALTSLANVTTLAGNTNTPLTYTTDPTAGSVMVTATGANASFNQPTGLTTDGTSLFVADYRNNVIRKIDITNGPNYGMVTRLAGSPAGVAGNANSSVITPDSATFNLPSAVTTDGTFVYVADTGNNTIRKVEIATGIVSLVAGSTASIVGAIDALNGSDARFNQPTGITTDGINLYVADAGNSTIRKIVISTGEVYTLAGAALNPGFADSAPSDVNGTNARFNQPARITTDGTNLYVTDFNNKTIRQIVIATGKVSTLAGTPGQVGSDNGAHDDTGTAARFNQPNGITTDGTNLYVTDSYLNSIRMIVIKTGVVTTIPGIFGAGGLLAPVGITTDGVSLFVANTYTLIKNIDNTTTYGNTILKIN